MDNQNPTAETPNNPRPKARYKAASSAYEILEIILTSICAVFLIFILLMRVAVVEGTSMTNTLQDGEKLLVWEALYTPKQGDVVICQSEYNNREALVKRVIATEGQTITVDLENWAVYVDGEKLDEDYVLYRAGVAMNGWVYGDSYTVPEGKVFVMGDNRNGSLDSRSNLVGPIDERWIVGKAIFRFAPLDRLGIIH